MDAIEAALQDLKLQDKPNISATARRHNVQRSTLSRRHNRVTTSVKIKHQNQEFLTQRQQQDLIKYINELTEKGIPPTTTMVRNFAQEMAGKKPHRCWSQRFCKRHQNVLASGYLNNIDAARKAADNEASYQYFFDLLKHKTEQYEVLPQNQYNMDEKGFLLGIMKKHHRVYTKSAFKQKKILGYSQDGNREWITIIGTICADGTAIPPCIIFAGKTEYLQTTWVEDVKIGQHQAHFASSPNGWTSDKLGLAWLQQVFDKHTKAKARNGRDWRLLILDGHGSHINISFLTFCEKHRILVAVYPPHSTHRLQPLDVSLFRPLAINYSNELNQFTSDREGISRLGKRDFFSLFWPAYTKAFTASNIASGWRKTGIYPLQSEVVLKQVAKPLPPLQERPSSNHSSRSSHLSATEWRRIEALVKGVVSETAAEITDKKVKKLQNTLSHLTTQNHILKAQNKGLKQAVYHEQKRRKRGKKLEEEFRAQEGGGAVFFSPQKIQALRDLDAQRQAVKEQEQANKQLAKEQQHQAKIAKEQEALQKRQQREEQRQQKEASALAARLAKAQAKDTLKAQQQLQKEHQASTKKLKRQQQQNIAPLQQPIFQNIEVNETPSNPASRLPPRIRKPPRHLAEYQVDR
jgi:hypothetical protein